MGVNSLFAFHHVPAHFLNSSNQTGGILTLADDFLKNDGRKFLDLMEQLAERKIKAAEYTANSNDENESDYEYSDHSTEWNDGYDDDDSGDYSDEGSYEEESVNSDDEELITEEERLEEGRRMFQLFAAKMCVFELLIS